MPDRPSSFALHRLVTPHYHRDPSGALLLISPYHIQGNPTANHPSFDSHSRVTPRNPRRLSSASLIISPVTRNENENKSLILHCSLVPQRMKPQMLRFLFTHPTRTVEPNDESFVLYFSLAIFNYRYSTAT